MWWHTMHLSHHVTYCTSSPIICIVCIQILVCLLSMWIHYEIIVQEHVFFYIYSFILSQCIWAQASMTAIYFSISCQGRWLQISYNGPLWNVLICQTVFAVKVYHSFGWPASQSHQSSKWCVTSARILLDRCVNLTLFCFTRICA